jgi:signal transduction histidine kinase
MKSHHDVFTLAVASALAVAFVISGILLYQQQRRSLKLARQRVSFVNQVSHELGSPLTNVTLNLDLAEEALGDRSPEAKHRLGLISQEVGRLNRLVANVLTFSQCDRGVLEIHKEPCFPDDVIAVILDSYRPALTRRGVEVEYVAGANARVDTDPDALSQIIANLVSNVEKYASAGQWLRVTTSLRNGQLIVSVMDHGPGIPQEARNRIFESFERVVTRVNEGSSGAGLGLSIASQLAIKLGGNLKLLDCDEGCHFELTIPSRVICSVIEENELVI